jgi:methanogenic corrinoid protein MtbC1
MNAESYKKEDNCQQADSEIPRGNATAEKLARLEGEVRELLPIGEAAAEEYREKTAALAAQVNSQILQRSDARDLIGSCPVDTIIANHSNHARFMGAVFSLNLPSLLTRVVPWAYRVYTTRGVSYEYFRAELTAWERAVSERLDEAHARSIRTVYEWILDHHEEMKELSAEMTSWFPPELDWSEDRETLLTNLLAGEYGKIRDGLGEVASNSKSLSELYLDDITPVMYRLGNLWATGEVSVSEEHMVTALVSRAMTAAYDEFALFEPTKGQIVVGCSTDEFHELGARVVADLLELDGWDVAFLGANCPAADFHHMVAEIQPEIVALSATIPHHLLRIRDMLGRLRGDSRLSGTRTMVGGMAFSAAPEAAEGVGADGWATDARDACQLAASWWEEGCWA